MSEESDLEKTEDPTPHRREKAREEGQIPRSKELTSLLMLLGGWSLLLTGGESIAQNLAQLLHHGLLIERAAAFDPQLMLRHVSGHMRMALFSIFSLLFGLFICGIVTPMFIGGLYFSGKSLKVDFKRMNPLSGFKRLFSAQMVSELVKSLLKVVLVSSACTLFLYGNQAHFIQLASESLYDALGDARTLISRCLLMVILSLVPMVGYDVFYQLISHLHKLRMTRQEIRDEFKQQEGDPHVKNRIKQMQRAAARQRMMADIPGADVIVNNPTHYSVALSYKEGNMKAPVVVAKGAGEVALRIREQAQLHRVPMLEAPPLARALFRHCDIGEPIPSELYSAVAEVLAWVYSLRRWKNGGGLLPKTPDQITVPQALDFKKESHD
ncbi:flagellar biosynthesis protein FlhB [Leclercia adecarboxylata]|nr:flagellar biosynthesis protein FlhB [Leclercia adecarboxylata]KMN61753.1 flagellar biosynthesis protein FlhB [Leclercia sp. LK8]